jgi:selenide,water dikinase
VVVGGGAGGVELLLSLRARLLKETGGAEFTFTLVTSRTILEQHNTGVKNAFRRAMNARNIVVREQRDVHALAAQGIELAGGETIAADAVLVTTDAAPPPWFAATGLTLDRGGFLAVGPTLQVLNDPNVFAAGDCAGLTASPRPKAGVFAVRAGPPLAENLRRRARNAPPRPWRPQKLHLALISTGERYAVASFGPFKAEGAWLWRLKDWIDRRWMAQYRDPR